jgi:hypothetical protein
MEARPPGVVRAGFAFDGFFDANQNGSQVAEIARKEVVVLALVFAIALGVVGAFAGGAANSTAAMSEGVLQFLGGCLGAITGAVIGGSMDIVRAINQRWVVPRQGQ